MVMLKLYCMRCHKELVAKGAILLSPPFHQGISEVYTKDHICVDCYHIIYDIIKSRVKITIGEE